MRVPRAAGARRAAPNAADGPCKPLYTTRVGQCDKLVTLCDTLPSR